MIKLASLPSTIFETTTATEGEENPLKQYGQTASVFCTAKHKRQMVVLDRYKMKSSGVKQKLQELAFMDRFEDFKRKVGRVN